MLIAVDFDGTCVTHEYPYMGVDVGAAPVLKKLVKAGHKLILYTMRSGRLEKEALEWFKKNDIPVYAVNENPEQKKWTQSLKVNADLYIDDNALGCPIKTSETCTRPFIDWEEVEKMLIKDGFI